MPFQDPFDMFCIYTVSSYTCITKCILEKLNDKRRNEIINLTVNK